MNDPYTFPLPYLWPVGLGGMVAPERVVAVGRWDSAPIRRDARRARRQGMLIDLTFGRACKWVVYLDTGQLALATQPMPVAMLDSDEFSSERFREDLYPEATSK